MKREPVRKAPSTLIDGVAHAPDRRRWDCAGERPVVSSAPCLDRDSLDLIECHGIRCAVLELVACSAGATASSSTEIRPMIAGSISGNSMFHSGVFRWLGVYFQQRYGVGPVGIGLALLGYGVPGFLFGPLIGRAADRWGRARLLPIGLGLSALAGALLILDFP
jgi:hypothetical protein